MKSILKTCFSLYLLFFCAPQLHAQVFWTETFGTGCNAGTLANGFVSANGTWTIDAPVANNDVDANRWYISATENGEGVGNCGAGCGTNPTLHIGGLTDNGADYSKGAQTSTDAKAISPAIDCSNKCAIELSFEYIENGDGTDDNLIVWYFDGAIWAVLEDTPKTPFGACAPQGLWASRTIGLPASADNNPAVQIGFQWVNNADGVGTDPSAAIYNIELSSNDNVVPTISCVSSVDVYIGAGCEAKTPLFYQAPEVIVSDNCTDVNNLVISQDIPFGTSIIGHNTTITVNVTVEDQAGNTNTCAINVNALDTLSPTFVCLPTQNVILDASCSATLGDYKSLVYATLLDNCTAKNDIVLNQSPAPGTIITASQNVEITATDEHGNLSKCNFIVEIIDNTDPVVTCPGNQSQNADVGICSAAINDYTSLVTWSDNCTTDPSLMFFQQSPAPGTQISGVNNVTLTVTDGSGNSSNCVFEVEVLDLENPTVVCPPNLDVYADSSCVFSIPNYIGNISAVDNCSGLSGLTFTQSPVEGTLISGAGTVQTITVVVEDEASNSNSCSFDITMIEDIQPEIACPSTQNEDADVNCEIILTDYTGLATVSDNCSAIADLVVTQNMAPGTVLNSGTHIIELLVEDESGNTKTCDFNLVVNDITAPDISSCAPNQFEPATASCDAVLGDYSALITVADACDPAATLSVTQSPSVGTNISGVTTVTLTVADLSGNTSSCSFDVDIIDTISPIADCSAGTTVTIDSNCEFAAPDVTSLVTGTDNCSVFSNMMLSQNIAPGTILTGAQTIDVTLTDENGNSNTCSFQINIDDVIAPTITCPTNQTVHNGTNCNYEITDFTTLATVSDNCGTPIVTQYPAPGTEIGAGIHVVELTATDGSGNISTCNFVLTVYESVAPTITCPAKITTCDPVVTYDAPIVVENCPNYTLTQTDISGYTSGSTFPIGITNQSFEVVDASGNTVSCNFDIEVLETPSPAVVLTLPESLCDQNSVILEATPPVSGVGEWTIVEGSSSLNNQFASTTEANNLSYGQNTFVWTVSSTSCGNNSDTVTISVFANPSQANTQDELTICDDTLVNIAATSPSIGVGSWSSVSGTASFLDTMAPNTVLYNLNEGWNQIVWTVSNGNCLSKTDTLRVFKKQNVQIFSPDTTVCMVNSGVQLHGTPIEPGSSGVWYVISGGVEFENQVSASPKLIHVNGGENIIVYGQNHPVCGKTTDTVIVTGIQCEEFNPVIPTMITPNNDGKNDLFVIKNLSVLYPNSEVRIVNRWGNLVFESVGYHEPWDGTYMNKGEDLPMGTYFYRILLNDSTNKEITGPISIIR